MSLTKRRLNYLEADARCGGIIGMTKNCICAERTDEYHGWKCSITDGACMYLYPNQAACAREYGEVEPPEEDNKNKC